MKPGGTEGGSGVATLGWGAVLLGLGLYLFLDSVRVVSGDFGAFSGMFHHRSGLSETTSMGIVFAPFMIGAIRLFYKSKSKWGWVLSGLGLMLIVVEILSRVRFVMNTKLTHLLLILLLIAAGAGLLLKSFQSRD